MGLRGINHAEAPGNHDGLVVAALHRVQIARNALLVFAEVTQQIRPPELIAKRRPAQRPFQHDLQRARNVLRLAIPPVIWGQIPIYFRYGKTGQPRLGLGAASGGTFVANFSARTGGSTGERRNGSRVVVGFHLHQNVLNGGRLLVEG